MTSNYDDFSEYVSPSSDSDDLEQREDRCFELLSAYIDEEATVAERKQVQQWLDNDPQIKQTYLQLLKLQNGMQSLSVPCSPTSNINLAEEVCKKIDSRRDHKRIAIWGSAIAATIIGTVVSIVPNSLSPFKMAKNTISEPVNQPTMVAVSLNKPAVIIPKAAVSTPNYQNRI